MPSYHSAKRSYLERSSSPTLFLSEWLYMRSQLLVDSILRDCPLPFVLGAFADGHRFQQGINPQHRSHIANAFIYRDE